MQPSNQNNQNLTGQNNAFYNSSSQRNYFETNSTLNNQFFKKQQQDDEDLLQGILDSSNSYPSNEVPRSYNFNRNVEQKELNFISQPMSFMIDRREIDSKRQLSKIDQDIEKLIKQSEEPIQNVSVEKQPLVSQKQIKHRNTLSRLSQQFFKKSGQINNQSNPIKSKNSRKTISSFEFQQINKNKVQPFKIKDLQDKNAFSFFPQKPVQQKVQTSRCQIMQIQNDSKKNPQILSHQEKTNLGKASNPETQNRDRSNLIQKPTIYPKNQQQQQTFYPTDPKSIEERLSQTKKRKQRVTMDMKSLINMLNGMDKSIKQQQKQKEKRNNRLTLDMKAIKSMLQRDIKQSQTQQPKINNPDKSRRITSYIKPPRQNTDGVIYEDEKQDEFTPYKNSQGQGYYNRRFSEGFNLTSKLKPPSSTFPNPPNPNIQSPTQQQQRKQKQVFDYYFKNIKQKVQQKKRQYQRLIRQRDDIQRQNRQILNKLKPDMKKINQSKQEEQILKTKIYELRKRFNKGNFVEYNNIIHQFQVMFGIRIFSFQKDNKRINMLRNNNYQGFFCQFSYNQIIFRLKRSQGEEVCASKFAVMATKKSVFSLQLDNSIKLSLYKSFITQKIRKAQTFLEVLIQVVNYCKFLNKFQLTLEYFSQMYNMNEIEINSSQDKLIIKIQLIQDKEVFTITVNLLSLLEDGGITMYNCYEKEYVKLPEEVTKFGPKTNKLGKCLEFMNDYVLVKMKNNIENKIKNISLN